MNRIENIIDNCHDCRWMGKYLSVNSNTDFAYICLKTERILILTCSKDSYKIDIPNLCTLPKTKLGKINQE